MSELKPCPFCVGEAFVRIDVALNPTQARYRVGCDKNPYCHGWYGHSRYYNTEAGAAAAWNTRHVETCKLNELDALTQTLSMVDGCAWSECSECGCLTPDDSTYCINCGRKVES